MLSSSGRDTILIVEDDQNVAEMLCTFLRTKQYRTIVTSQGAEAINLCREQSPSLVLLDINLPDMDGYEVCRRLRENLSTSSIPILFLTQKNLREDKLSGLSIGGDDYITKPFDMEELHLRMTNALRRARYRSGIDQASGLPSGPLVEARLKDLLHRGEWAVMLVSVCNFGCFTQRYRQLKGQFASYVGELLRQAVDQVGNFEDFVGRVGTVDFVIITTPPRVARLQERIERKFTQAMDPACSADDKKPITAALSLSFGVVYPHDGPFSDVRSLAEAVTRSRSKQPAP